MVKAASLIWLSAVLCLLNVVGAKDIQIKLEDIEQDNLSGEKTLQQPQQQINQQQRATGTLQNLPPRQYFATATAAPPPPPPPTSPAVPPQESTGPHQFSPDARQFPPAPPLQVQFPNRIPQQQLVIAPQQEFLQYLAQSRIGGHDQQYQFQFIPSDNANNVIQDPYLQQYFAQSTPQQYIYLQPQASQNIPVQTKPQNLGGIQYLQYLDPSTELLRNPNTHAQLANHHQKSSHNLAGLLQRYAHTNTLPLNYKQPAPQTYRPQGQAQPLLNQNVYVVPQVVQPVNANLQPLYQHQLQPQRQRPQVLGQQRFLVPGITYANRQQQQSQPLYQQQLVYQQPQPQQPIYQQPQGQQPIYQQSQAQQFQAQQSQAQQFQAQQSQAQQSQVQQSIYQQPQFQQPQFQQPQFQQPQFHQPQFQQQEAQQSIANIVYEKRAPKSLLDSYVPSVLQIQYIKQLQEQQQQQQQQQQRKANALRSEAKLNENISGKNDYQKSLPQVSEPAKETVYEYQYQ